MKKYTYLTLLLTLTALLFQGCATPPHQQTKKSSPLIMGKGKASPETMASFLQKNNPKVDDKTALSMANLYIQEASTEGVNHDIAFIQMCHETNFLKFGNQVSKKQYNFAGLGATDDGSKGASFPSIKIGIRAQIQHLKAYASRKKLRNPIVDPRFSLVKRASAPSMHQLATRWASDPLYGDKLHKKLNALLQTP